MMQLIRLVAYQPYGAQLTGEIAMLKPWLLKILIAQVFNSIRELQVGALWRCHESGTHKKRELTLPTLYKEID